MNKKQQLIYNEIISKYNFDNDQKTQIREGLENNIDVNYYAKPEFNHKQMSKIREGLRGGIRCLMVC